MLNEATQGFIRQHSSDDVRLLALKWKAGDLPDVDLPCALNQIASLQKSKAKLPSWGLNDSIIYPPPISLEQCSSEATARYKASLVAGEVFADLTGGFGVDTAFLAPNFRKGYYVERQEGLARLARHNFQVLNLSHLEVICADSVPFMENLSPVDCLYLDPARRSGKGKKVVLIQDCEPDVVRAQDRLLSIAKKVLVKLSPMLDITAAMRDVRAIEQVHVLSVDNECKELLLLMDREVKGEPEVACVNIHRGQIQADHFRYSQEKEITLTCAENIEEYLYEPNTSILKAGFYKAVALKYNVKKLHANTHLYTSTELVRDFPGRIFRVTGVSSWNKKELKGMLAGIEKANISVRNFPVSVDELRKKLKLNEGGETYLFATTIAHERRVLLRTSQLFLS